MTATRDPDRLLRAWLDLMPDEAPDRAIAAVLQATTATPQARVLPWHRPRRLEMNRLSLIAVTAMVALALVAGAIIVATGRPAPTQPIPSPVTPTPASPALRSDPTLDGPIAVSATGGIYLVELDGTTTKLAIDGAVDTSCPTFSRDGQELAVHVYDPINDADTLVVQTLDGVEHGLWTGAMSNSFHQIGWSADGAAVLMNGLLGGPSGGPQTVVSRRTSIPRSGLEQTSIYDWWGGELPGSFALSPDGSQVAVSISEGPDGPSRIDVHVLAAGTTRTVARGFIGDVAWSPDGTTITYTASTTFGGTADLHFVNADGSQDRILYRGESAEGFGFMAWSAEWDILGVLERIDTKFRIRVLDAAGRELAQIGPYDRSPNLSFTWAPGGDAVLLTTSAGTGGLSGGPPMIAYLDGRTLQVGLPTGTANACPLGWGRVTGT